MAKDIIFLSYTLDNLIKKYLKALRADDFYSAQLLYNRIMELAWENEDTKSELNIRHSFIYSRLGSLFYEADNLIKAIKNKDFKNFNPRTVALRLSLFFNVYYETDCKDYYFDLFKARGMNVIGAELPDVLTNKWQKSIHFVEDDGFYKMGDAINLMSKGNPEQAIVAISEVDKDDKNYTKVQNFKASLLVIRHDYSQAKNILIELVNAGQADEETFKALYCLPNLTTEDLENMLSKLQTIKADFRTDSLECVEASVLSSLNRSQEALEILQKIDSITRFDESYLALKAKCYGDIKDSENLKETLKIISALYPGLPFARLALIKLELGEEINCVEYLKEAPQKPIVKIAKKYLVEQFKSKWQQNMTFESARFMINLSLSVGDFNLIRAVVRGVYRSKYQSLLFDYLVSVFVSPQDLQVILQVILEEREERELQILYFTRLQSVQFGYPEFFNLCDCEDKEKYAYLLSAYAQSATLAFFEGLDLNKLKVNSNKLLEKLYSANLDELTILKYSDNLSFLLLSFCYPEEEKLLDLFFKMSEELKQEILKFLN